MASAWRSRILATVGITGVVVFGIASPAWADPTTISINPGNIAVGGTAAATFSTKSCDPNLGGGPSVGKDVWVFNLPSDGPEAEKSTFVSITATFATGSGTVTKTIPPDGSIVFIGTSKGVVTTPAGWKLTGATAVVTKAEPFFVLTHTCPATVATTPVPTSPVPTSPAATTPAPQTSTQATSAVPTTGTAATTAQAPTSAVPTTAVAPATAATTPPVPGGLPVTGGAVGGLIAGGFGLIAAGAGLLFLHRRRRTGAEA
jgi:hypothetical protein